MKIKKCATLNMLTRLLFLREENLVNKYIIWFVTFNISYAEVTVEQYVIIMSQLTNLNNSLCPLWDNVGCVAGCYLSAMASASCLRRSLVDCGVDG